MSATQWQRSALGATALVAALVLSLIASGPATAQPSAPPVGSTQPDAGQPDAGQPDAGQPDAGQPDAGQPDAGQPGQAQPPAEPQSAPPPPAAPGGSAAPTPAQLEQAKRLFLQGNELRKAGDFERALDYYVRSRSQVRSVANTINAALCLDQLGRYDESLELYEELLTELGERLTDDDRESIAPHMTKLRAQVGSIDVQANVKGSLVIDGRARGSVPLTAPVRVLPGRHLVVVVQEGYQSFETTAQVTIGETARVSARLEPLAAAGKLRVDEAALAGAEVYVDGARVGTVPWEGALEPGAHHYYLRKGDQGSGPRAVTVVKGQTVLGAARLEPLGPELRVAVSPPTAELAIDDVTVGKGRWQGRLPLGAHKLEAREEGYFDKATSLSIRSDMEGAVEIRLQVDEAHPRWSTGEAGRGWIEAVGAFGFAPSLGSGAEASCDAASFECTSNPMALGFLVGARGGYEFPIGLSIELEAGYLSLSKTLSRRYHTFVDPTSRQDPLRYELQDEQRVHGPFALVGVSYRQPLGEVAELRAHLLAGPVFTFARDRIGGTATAGGQTLPAAIQASGETQTTADLALVPELHLGLRLGGFGVSAGVAAAVLVMPGPKLLNTNLRAPGDNSPCATTPAQPACARASDALADEPAYGTMVMLLPGIAAGYAF
jgi:hypothetical protein